MILSAIANAVFALTGRRVRQTPPAYAACTGKCTSDLWCQQCSGISYAFCVGGRCAF